MNIFIDNLSFEEEDLPQAFGSFGQLSSVKIITDRDTGRSRGFGFVEMPNNDEAQSAIRGLNNTELKGRTIKVNEARPRSESRQGRGRR